MKAGAEAGDPVTGSLVRESDLERGECSRYWWDLQLQKLEPQPGEGIALTRRGLPGGFAQTPVQPGKFGFQQDRCRRGFQSRLQCQPAHRGYFKSSFIFVAPDVQKDVHYPIIHVSVTENQL